MKCPKCGKPTAFLHATSGKSLCYSEGCDWFQGKHERDQTWWDKYFLGLAKYISIPSKDPSTKTGAVITDGKRIVVTGYNGFACGIDDTPERLNNREEKYKRIIHCERNAILFAREPLNGFTLYTWPFPSCWPCAAMVIQKGIKRVVAPPVPDSLKERWGTDCDGAISDFKEAGVEVCLMDLVEVSA